MQEVGDAVKIAQVICLDCPKVGFVFLFFLGAEKQTFSLQEVMWARVSKRGESSGRTDDNLTSFNKRLDTYNNETSVVLKVFEKQGLLRKIDASRGVDEVFNDLKKLFE